jgi:hypothetical protein
MTIRLGPKATTSTSCRQEWPRWAQTTNPCRRGDALRAYHRARLPEGERKILDLACAAWPRSVEREFIGNETGYKRSTRDAYLHRLLVRKLIWQNADGLCASNLLFDD